MSQRSHGRSVKAQKTEEVQAAGNAKAGAGYPDVKEGGPVEAPSEGQGHAKPAASTANIDGASQDRTSSATTGKAEKCAAAGAGHAKEQHGRGRRKAEQE